MVSRVWYRVYSVEYLEITIAIMCFESLCSFVVFVFVADTGEEGQRERKREEEISGQRCASRM